MTSTATKRVPYRELTDAQREELHAWCHLHDVDHTLVPVDADIRFDRATNEWRIPIQRRRDGHAYVDGAGNVATTTVRRPWRAWLPWPTRPAA